MMKATDREGVWIEEDVYPGLDMVVDCNEINNVPSITINKDKAYMCRFEFKHGVRISDIEAVKYHLASYYLMTKSTAHVKAG